MYTRSSTAGQIFGRSDQRPHKYHRLRRQRQRCRDQMAHVEVTRRQVVNHMVDHMEPGRYRRHRDDQPVRTRCTRRHDEPEPDRHHIGPQVAGIVAVVWREVTDVGIEPRRCQELGEARQQVEDSQAGQDRSEERLGRGARAYRPSLIRIPWRARSVTSGIVSTGCPGTRVNRKRWTTITRMSCASTSAKVLPMHWRGPPPNGK